MTEVFRSTSFSGHVHSHVVAYYAIHLAGDTDNIYELVGQRRVVVLFVWFVVDDMCKRFTHHRGMMRSFPAAVVAALVVRIGVRALGAHDLAMRMFAVGAGAGYLTHLVLDEMHAMVSSDGYLL